MVGRKKKGSVGQTMGWPTLPFPMNFAWWEKRIKNRRGERPDSSPLFKGGPIPSPRNGLETPILSPRNSTQDNGVGKGGEVRTGERKTCHFSFSWTPHPLFFQTDPKKKCFFVAEMVFFAPPTLEPFHQCESQTGRSRFQQTNLLTSPLPRSLIDGGTQCSHVNVNYWIAGTGNVDKKRGGGTGRGWYFKTPNTIETSTWILLSLNRPPQKEGKRSNQKMGYPMKKKKGSGQL